ncbi:helix-turn-helix transcriptional regulator [Flavicella sp.]|uniref:helix-turn-helix transcriptional regulator n=1 Tax=Flavicella sp. TaxID=2957742 RepID=UPI00301612ED
MYFHKKLKEYFTNKGLNNRQIANEIGYSEAMVGRYLTKSKPNFELLTRIVKSYPDIDLNKLFKEKYSNTVQEEPAIYTKESIAIINNIEKELQALKDKIDPV